MDAVRVNEDAEPKTTEPPPVEAETVAKEDEPTPVVEVEAKIPSEP